ncbi:MAG: hypothetical protein M3R43_09155, partial [Acidobacteriota bacterium]|nr:hypothetical protein [Acidobacteriota bacterium]
MIHINALLALAAALLWGGGDFCGGMGVGAASSESISPSGMTERKAKATADRQARATADRKERATAERRAGATADSAAGGKLGAALRVVMLSNVSSFAVLVGIVLLRHEPMPHGRLLAWALLGG